MEAEEKRQVDDPKVDRNDWRKVVSLWLAHLLSAIVITREWTAPFRNWVLVLNQLVIRFEDRIAI